VLRALAEIHLAHRRSREEWQPKQANVGKDRRVFYRVPVTLPCLLVHPMFGLEVLAATVNMSLEGAGLSAPVNWSEGSRVHLRFEAIGLDVDGIIVFRKEEAPRFRYGVMFQKLGLFQILKLRRFLRSQHTGRLSL
jgi:hypothetical protein